MLHCKSRREPLCELSPITVRRSPQATDDECESGGRVPDGRRECRGLESYGQRQQWDPDGYDTADLTHATVEKADLELQGKEKRNGPNLTRSDRENTDLELGDVCRDEA
jgi:hypothetical protein